jgi:aldehyde dehydrogenase (NAD+)
MSSIDSILSNQKKFFLSGQTKNIQFRKTQLNILLNTVIKFERKILDACFADFGKPESEAYISEIGAVCHEIRYALKNIETWAKPEKVSGSWLTFPSSSYIYREPFGRVLILGPWNYPLYLCLSPLIGSIAAGNCTVIKPSELTPRCAAVLHAMINAAFDPGYIAVIEGDSVVSTTLLQHQFDHIFFTGSSAIGKKVMAAAAQYLTPVTLELGGKSPCIVDQNINLEVTAKRILFGKLLNAGQTCIAPDYIFVHHSVRDKFVELLIKYIQEFHPNLNANTNSYTKIVNHKHFNRLKNLLVNQKIIYGGILDEKNRFISPTLIDSPNLNDPIMQEEIFGPLLPILSYTDINTVIQNINHQPKPLALYLFSNNKNIQKNILNNISFGGGCINDTMIHLSHFNLPFGGVGESGMGAYHGRYSFETFSHRKSIVKKSFFFDFNFRYPPYENKLWLIRKILG